MTPTNGQHFKLHGGVGTIGGTKLEVIAGPTRMLFDFGTAFEPGKGAFDTALRPRPDRAAFDHVALGIAPPLGGLYPEPMVLPDGERVGDATDPLPIFITHLHLDHVGLLPLLDPSVPVYMSRDSARLAALLDDVGEGIGDHDLRLLDDGETVELGHVRVRLHAVDHDIPGASAFLVEGPTGRLLYSGDLRGHGLAPERNDALIDELSGTVGTLLLEGTRLADGSPALPEKAIGSTVTVLLSTARGAAVNFYARNVERMRALAEATAEAGRRLVLTPGSLRILEGWFGADRVGTWRVAGFQPPGAATPPDPVTRTLAQADVIPTDAIRDHPERYLVELPYAALTSLASGLLPAGSLYIHSDGVPLGPFDPAFTNMDHWLARFGLQRVDVRSNGHADAAYLATIVERIAPDRLYAIHSKAPERMPAPPSGVRILPALGVPYVW